MLTEKQARVLRALLERPITAEEVQAALPDLSLHSVQTILGQLDTNTPFVHEDTNGLFHITFGGIDEAIKPD